MASQFANTLCINQEIIITLKFKKNPRDSLIFVTSEHFDSPESLHFPKTVKGLLR